MSQPHLIRLSSPWQFRVVSHVGPRTASDDADLWPTDEPIRVQVPADWSAILGTSFRGGVEYSRFFHQPTGIDTDTRIQLRLELVDGVATVSLNDELLGTACWPDFPKRFDITGRLRNRNELRIGVELLEADQGAIATDRPPGRTTSNAGGLVGEVLLEIG